MNDKTIRNFRGTVFYDGACRFCTRWARRVRPLLERKSIELLPFEKGADELEMQVLWRDGRVYGGAEALRFLARQFWYTVPLALLAGLPGIRGLSDAIYRFLAKRRHCFGDYCALKFARRHTNSVSWLILVLFVGAAFVSGLASPISSWLWMWILAGALWVAFKCMNYRLAGGIRMVDPLYFFWVGTEAEAFRYGNKAVASRPKLKNCLVFIGLGFVVLIGVFPHFNHPIALGWLGIFAMLFLFHFGIFGLLGGFLNILGVAVEPIMDAPWKAKSLMDFWGPRWNRAFSGWARVWIFRPLVRKLGVRWGTLAGFLASGISHELVISVPARGGLGLPTLYFALQAAGVLVQRRVSAFRGRFFTLVMVLLPAPILFHTFFLERVFAPMMRELSTLITL